MASYQFWMEQARRWDQCVDFGAPMSAWDMPMLVEAREAREQGREPSMVNVREARERINKLRGV